MDNMLKYKDLSDVEERINKNHKFIKELEKLISDQISDIEKIDLITLIGQFYSVYVTGIYASLELENEIIKIGQSITFEKKREPKKNHILIVMTESGAVGGHSVLVNNWMRWDVENSYSVAFTNQNYEDVVDFIKISVESSCGEIFCLEGDYISKTKKLMDISQDFQKVLLFTHMYDVVPVLAYGNNRWEIPVLFYNHADFRFSFGFSIADRILELSPYDQDKTERFRGVPKGQSIVVQFPNGGKIVESPDKQKINKRLLNKKELKHLLAEKYGFNENEKLIVSAGADFKYENILGYEFDNFVSVLLDKYNYKANFLIIGADKEKEKWKKLYNVTGGRGRALGVLPRQEMEDLIAVADLYIVSFPMAASGAMLAKESEVPYLALFIIERGMEAYGDNAARSIDELLNKSLDILNGNGNKYLKSKKEYYVNQAEWCSQWKKVLEDANEHSITQISPHRYIETQEYVNCQLMQDTASDNMARYLYSHEYSQQVEECLFYLDKKYGMNIYNKIEILKRDIALNSANKALNSANIALNSARYYSDKHLKLYLLALKWIQLKQAGKHIENYLLDKGYSAIAIYGMSYMGTTLLGDVDRNMIDIRYGIDAKADKITSSIPVFFPKDELPEADVIINTTTLDNEVIREGLKNKDFELLSFGQVIGELLEG